MAKDQDERRTETMAKLTAATLSYTRHHLDAVQEQFERTLEQILAAREPRSTATAADYWNRVAIDACLGHCEGVKLTGQMITLACWSEAINRGEDPVIVCEPVSEYWDERYRRCQEDCRN